jgi:FkbM family methyltransferase
VPEPDLIYDIGAHYGEDSAYYLALGYRVVAFEANSNLVAHCRERFRQEIADGRMTLVEGAISTEVGAGRTISFFQHRLSEWSTADSDRIANRFGGIDDGTVAEVEVVDLPFFLRKIGVPYYMKSDVEGADLACLYALQAVDDRPQFLSLESGQDSITDVADELTVLSELGYRRFAVVQQATIPARAREVRAFDRSPVKYTFEQHASGPFGDDIGPWIDRDQALRRYHWVFRTYRASNARLIRNTRIGRGLRGQIQARLGIPLPGWYDTHARLD